MATENLIPIADLFEAHLTVSDLDRAVAFYSDLLSLPLARVFPDRQVAFFWIGAPGKAMLGLWEAGTMPISVSLHVAFHPANGDDPHLGRDRQAGSNCRPAHGPELFS